MQELTGKKILLGLCGGIAAYKAAYLVRELTELGAVVRVVMTESAKQFITPLTLQALSGNEVRSALFDSQAERAMSHIELARWADAVVVAPASANLIAKLANGLADDLLTTVCLVTERPLFVCPAMNRAMWAHPATIANCALLRARQVRFVGPDEGSQACGEVGLGRLSALEDIVTALRLMDVGEWLSGLHVLITAAATKEFIDPVRYIGNQSSGKMGYALACAAKAAGAEVTLISGPSNETIPTGVHYYPVVTATEMFNQVMAQLKPGMIVIAAAAVADYRAASVAPSKIKKQTGESLILELVPNPDIVSQVVNQRKASFVVAFAAETDNLLDNAKKKLRAKQVNMVVANAVGEGIGFDCDENTVTVLTPESQQELPRMHKTHLAGELIAIIARHLQNVTQI